MTRTCEPGQRHQRQDAHAACKANHLCQTVVVLAQDRQRLQRIRQPASIVSPIARCVGVHWAEGGTDSRPSPLQMMRPAPMNFRTRKREFAMKISPVSLRSNPIRLGSFFLTSVAGALANLINPLCFSLWSATTHEWASEQCRNAGSGRETNPLPNAPPESVRTNIAMDTDTKSRDCTQAHTHEQGNHQ